MNTPGNIHHRPINAGMTRPARRAIIIALLASSITTGAPAMATGATPDCRLATRIDPAVSDTAFDIHLEVNCPEPTGPWSITVERDGTVLPTGATGAATASTRDRIWRTGGYTARAEHPDGTVITTGFDVTAAPNRTPVPQPPGAPHPAPLPGAEPGGAIGEGANPRIERITGPLARRLSALNRRACTPIHQLRIVSINYHGFDGYDHRGHILIHKKAARATAGAFTDLWRTGFPIRHMVGVERFGRNPRGPGFDDYHSMRADNTSGYNCRYVVGAERKHRWSPHARGIALDVNPFENPYASPVGILPDPWYAHRARRNCPGCLRPGSAALRAFTKRGFRWGGAWANPDWQHLETRTGHTRGGSTGLVFRPPGD